MRLYGIAVALVVLVSCADPVIGPDPTSNVGGNGQGAGGEDGGGIETLSGTRIKVSRLAADDGSTGPIGWYDSELHVACLWAKASDGTLRCLPEATRSTFFADNACSQPLAVSRCGAPAFISVVDACGLTTIHEGGPEASPEGFFKIAENGQCVSSVSPGGPVYAAAGEIAAVSFVAGAVGVTQ
jgi:hypothetical protein